MSKLIKVIGPAIGMGFFAGLLWKEINALATTDGVGILARQGWPLNSFGTLVVLGAVAGVIVGRLLESRRLAHERDLAEVSRRMRLAYLPSAERLREDHPGLDQMPLFRYWSNGANRMSGRVAGRPVEIFDYTVVARDQNGGRATRRTVVLLPGAGLPDFDLRPRTLGARLLSVVGVEGITFDPAGAEDPDDAGAVEMFNRLYLVAAPDLSTFLARSLAPPDPALGADEEQAVRRLFVPDLMRDLTRYPGWSAQAHGGYLALWRGGIPIADYGPTIGFGSVSSGSIEMVMRRPSRFCPARERPKLLEEALGLHDALNRSNPGQVVAPVIPPVPGASRTKQGDRLAGAAIGAVLGLLCGFIAVNGLFALPHSQAAKQLGGLAPIAMGLIFFGGILLGTVSGAAVGALLSSIYPRWGTRGTSRCGGSTTSDRSSSIEGGTNRS